MSVPFFNVNLLRVILEGETDADSPGSEELMSQVRENWEVFLMLAFYTGDSGTATENPAEETLTDDGAAYDVDEHNGRSLVIIDGNAAGNVYTIDDTTATTLVCTGDTLLTDGVLSGDAYKVFYNLKNTSGHTHDDVDSPFVVLADDQVTQAKIANSAIGQAQLKTTTQTQSFDIPTTSSHSFYLTGGQYCFRPTAKGETTNIRWAGQSSITVAYTTVVSLYNQDGGAARFGYVLQRYVQASGEVYWIYILRDKATKDIVGMSACADHPCFGNSQDPEAESHMFGDYDQAKYEIIVINPSPEEVLELEKKTTPNKSVVEVITESYEINETIEPNWPDIPVTVGLPPDWADKPMGAKIIPIKKIISQPTYIKTAALKAKAVVVETG